MTYVFSIDGTTVERTRGSLPSHFVRDLVTNEWSVATDTDHERFGWYLLTEVPDPGDSIRTITNTGPGLFTEVWTFDQASQDARLDAEDRSADALALRDDLQVAKDGRDAAAQSRADMDPLGPPLSKWTPIDETAFDSGISNGLRIAELEARLTQALKLVNNLLKEDRRQYGDFRSIFALLVRKLRKDRDDE